MKPSFTHRLFSAVFTSAFILASIPPSLAQEPKDDITLVKKIHAIILQSSAVSEEGKIKNYSSIIPKTKVPYDMIALKGGTFLMGSATGPEPSQL